MRDHLEKYILANKRALDVHRPSSQLWNRIHQQLAEPETSLPETSLPETPLPNKSRRQFPYAKIAAAIAVTLCVGGGIFWKTTLQPSSSETVISNVENTHLNQMEAYYQTAIKAKEEQIRLFQQGGVHPDESLFFQIQRLQDLYQDLRKELMESQDPDVVVNAMMQNLTMQMEILNQQLMILEQIKSMKNEKDSRL
ncbi:MAG: hypothetical protein SF052_24065 [Bacteroidia bacterium]|nr:hypothetical protein [Bacteroidia bacterium]